jgi:hypothetical protein
MLRGEGPPNPSNVTYGDVDNSGTPGNVTANVIAGRVAVAAAASTMKLTNSLIKATSIVLLQVISNDTTAKSASVVPANGSAVITTNVATTAATTIAFVVFN